MRKVILYGELGKRFGRDHTLAVKSASEAIRALCVNFKGFKSFMKEAHKYGVGFKVFVGNTSLSKEKEASLPSGDKDTIRISPAVFGSGGFVKALIGAVLIVGGIIVGGGSLGSLTPAGSAMVSAGLGLFLNGVYELLTPIPSPSAQGAGGSGTQSYIFSGPENVTQQGGAVPLGYGRMMVGSTVISAGIVDQDQTL